MTGAMLLPTNIAGSPRYVMGVHKA